MDVTGFLKALEAPELRVPRSRWTAWALGETKVYRGRILSHVEWLPFEAQFGDVVERQAAGEDVNELLHKVFAAYLEAIGIPVRVVFGLPTAAVVQAMTDFLVLQRKAISGTMGPTSGKDSRQKADVDPVKQKRRPRRQRRPLGVA